MPKDCCSLDWQDLSGMIKMKKKMIKVVIRVVSMQRKNVFTYFSHAKSEHIHTFLNAMGPTIRVSNDTNHTFFKSMMESFSAREENARRLPKVRPTIFEPNDQNDYEQKKCC